MIANYHTHTTRCQHAFGTEREYVERAIREGLKILGFSDHAAVSFPNYYSKIRMSPSEVEDYVTTVLDLRDEYRDDIEIHLGMEVEYYPDHYKQQLDMLCDYPIEYYLLGQHFTNNEYDGVYCGNPVQDDEILVRYCRQSEEALRTGSFTYFAHPDLICYKGDRAVYEKNMRQLCETARSLSVPLEINILGIARRRNYPDPFFWKIAGEVGNDVVLGSDAHEPDQVLNKQAVETAMRIVEENHLHLLEKVELVNPFC